jgi:hypothetical protein
MAEMPAVISKERVYEIQKKDALPSRQRRAFIKKRMDGQLYPMLL